MHKRGWFTLAILVVLLVSTPASASRTGFTALAPGTTNPNRVDISVNVAANGTATWTVSYWTKLTTRNDTAAFESIQRDVRNNTSAYLDPFRHRIETTVATAANATGRPMNASNFSISTRQQALVSQYGIVTYHFTWRGFAAVNSRQVKAGDAIAGFYLDKNTTLTFNAPSGYTVASASPPGHQSEGRVKWHGPLTFTAHDPRVTFQPKGPTVPWSLVIGVAAVALALIGVGGIWYRRRTTRLRDDTDDKSNDGTPETTPPPDAEAGGGDDEKDSGVSEPPLDLLSNEEQVKRFLRQQGGRARQQELVAATGWTEARTSQVVSGMRDAGELESFRIGRENVLKLPDSDDDADDTDERTSRGDDDDDR